MIVQVITAVGALGLITWLQWPSLQEASRLTRWLYLSLLGVSGVIWILVMGNMKMAHPAAWLLYVLEPFDPIQ